MRKILMTIVVALGLLLGLVSVNAAQASHEVNFNDAGPFDLSEGSPNAGVHVPVGSVELGPGVWNIEAMARLFVGDPENETGKPADDQKNSQGCGLYVRDGRPNEQVAGAGGSSSLWTSIEGGKEVVLPLRQPPSWTTPVNILLLGNALVELECFIDASHSGVTQEDREGMVATDVSISAVHVGPVDGDDGDDGDDGSDGSDGTDGSDGADGNQGPAGTDGSDGADGSDGTDGADGEVKTVTQSITTPTRINTGR